MTPTVLGAFSGVMIAVGAAALVWRPRARLAHRLGNVARDGEPSAAWVARSDRGATTVALRLFGPPLRALAGRLRRLPGRARDDELALRLRRAGYADLSTDEYRVRVAATVGVFTVAGLVLGAAFLRSPAGALGAGACGAVYGCTRWRGRLDRSASLRDEQMRLELATINYLLAIHVQTGAGVIQATQRIVDRAHGVVVTDLREALDWVRAGMSEGEALRRVAQLAGEPNAARTYRLLATGAERGADLGGALRALTDDLRDDRRDALRRTATKRRAAMLVPTIAVLAPVMLLFIAAPLPSIVFGNR